MGKKTIRFSQGGLFRIKNIEYELTYDLFVEYLLKGYEFWFKYKDKSIDIAHYKENKGTTKKIYHLSINDMNDIECINGKHQYFNSPEELIEKGRIDGKTIKEVWDELET